MFGRLLIQVALLLAFVQAIPCAGQNLVPNPSFELYNNCPNSSSGVSYSPGYNSFPTVQSWVNPLQSSSADYFNSCAPSNSYVSTPGNGFGYQSPHNGNAYVGIIAWEGSTSSGTLTSIFAEYIQCKLTSPLVAGAKYCVNFYVHNGVSLSGYNFVGIDNIGVHFSSNKTNAITGNTLSLPASVQNTPGNFINDTTNWTKLTMTYTATGGEEWMNIGWFDNGAVPAFVNVSPAVANPVFNYRCYLFIDDVSVVEIKNTDTFYTKQDSLYCKNLSSGMTLQSTAPLADYVWNTGGTGDKLQITDTGIYWCVGTAGCFTYIDSFIVTYDSTPKLSLGVDVINCMNQPVTLAANFKADKYTWNTGDTTQTITAPKTGVYKLSVTGKCGVQSDSVNVFIQPPTAPPQSVDTTVCQFVQDIVVQVSDTALQWYTHEEGRIGSKIQPSILTGEPGIYHLFITTTVGKCESEKVPVDVRIKYTPHEELGNKLVMCENDIQVLGKMDTGVVYKWNTGANTCCVKPGREGLYQRATNNECGSYVDSVWVYHKSCEECIVFPNAFTPVKGMANNVFRPLLKCPVNEFKIHIYNRWGNLVYQSDNVYQGWNGRYDYDWAPVGTYVYVVEYTAKGKLQKQTITGNVTLLR